MVEYHVNAYAGFQERMKEEKFGGRLSVHKPSNSKALISFGHDKCIFKQFTFSAKSWQGPNGEIVVIPKDDGLGIMISTFQSHEFGFGFDLTNSDLMEVNKYHEERHTRMRKLHKQHKSMVQTSHHLPKTHSLKSSNMVLQTRVTGCISTWCANLKTVSMF